MPAAHANREVGCAVGLQKVLALETKIGSVPRTDTARHMHNWHMDFLHSSHIFEGITQIDHLL